MVHRICLSASDIFDNSGLYSTLTLLQERKTKTEGSFWINCPSQNKGEDFLALSSSSAEMFWLLMCEHQNWCTVPVFSPCSPQIRNKVIKCDLQRKRQKYRASDPVPEK